MRFLKKLGEISVRDLIIIQCAAAGFASVVTLIAEHFYRVGDLTVVPIALLAIVVLTLTNKWWGKYSFKRLPGLEQDDQLAVLVGTALFTEFSTLFAQRCLGMSSLVALPLSLAWLVTLTFGIGKLRRAK